MAGGEVPSHRAGDRSAQTSSPAEVGAIADFTEGTIERRSQPGPVVPATVPRSSGAELITASVLTLASSVTGVVVALFRSKLVAVLLGPAGVGALANLGVYNTFITTAGSAFSGQGATRAIAAARSAGSPDRVDWLIRYSLIVPPIVGVIMGLVTLALSPVISAIVMGDERYAPLVAISAAAIPLGLLTAGYSQILQGFVLIGSLARANIATTLASLLLTVGLVVAFGLTGAVVATSLIAVVQFGIYYRREPWVIRARAWRRHLPFDWVTLRPVIQLGLAGVILGIASTLVSLLIRTDIARVLGLEQSGVYQPVSAISDTYLELLLSSTSFYLFPRLTELLTSGRPRDAAFELGHGMRLMLAVSVPFLLLSVAFGEPIVLLLYSSRFRGAVDPLAIQMAGNVFKAITWSVGAALLPLGYYRIWLGIGLANLAIKYVGVLVLLPHMGLDGVAWATSISWVWSAVAEASAVVVLGRLTIPARDWRVAFAAVALVEMTLAVRTLSQPAAMLFAAGAAIAWLALTRAEVSDLARTLSQIAGRQVAALRAMRGHHG